MVVPNPCVSLLGRDLCSRMKIKLKMPDKNIYSLKNNVLNKYDEYLSDDFVSSVQVTVKLPMQQNITPVFQKARSVPIRYKELVCNELKRLESAGVVTKTLSSPWASPTVNVLKSNNQIRICGDYSKTINKFMEVTRFPLPSIEDVIAQVGNAKYFSKIDLETAFLQVPLDEESKKCTTINTHEGLYHFNYLPLGTSASPAIFQNFICKILNNIDSIVIYQDDILLMTETIEHHNAMLDKVLNTLKEARIKVNRNKSDFFTEKVSYLGHIFDGNGVHPDSDKVRSIQEASHPKNIKELQSFIGLCNFYNRFIKNFSDVFSPLYKLLRKDVKFSWGIEQQKCFELIKKLFKTDIVLRTFNPKLTTAIETDASCYGIGVALMQLHADGKWYPVQFASRSLNCAEQHYSQIEREALSILFGCEKFKKFLLGCKFIVKNDHKPLQKLFGSNSSIPENCSARLQRWALRLSQFQYKVEYIKGSENVNGDFLSRFPLQETSHVDEPYEMIFVVKAIDNLPITCDNIKTHTDNDKKLSKIKYYIMNGFPSVLDQELCQFKNIIDELSIIKGCLMYKNRVFIPESIRAQVLDIFHSNHPGISAMKQISRALIWYPGLDQDVENIVRSCTTCQNNQAKPPQNNTIQWPKAEKRWSRIHVDHFFYEDYVFFIVIDSFSKYIECLLVKSTSSNCTIEALREIFSRNGLCDTIVSDNATSFVSAEFKQFLAENNIQHVTPPPYSPSSNGQGECAVRVIKNLLKKNINGSIKTRLHNVLLYYRSTPHSVTKISPAVCLNNRKLVTLKERINPNFVASQKKEDKKIKCFDIGDSVLVLNVRPGPKWYRGVIMEKLGENIYEVYIQELDRLWRRHTNQLLKNNSDMKNENFNSKCSDNVDMLPGSSSAASAIPVNVSNCVDNAIIDSDVIDQNLNSFANNDAPIDCSINLPRRSTRIPKPVDRLNL